MKFCPFNRVRYFTVITALSGMIVTSALIIWKALMCITGSESPVVVVLSGSMEPGFKRVILSLLFVRHLVCDILIQP